MVNLHATTEPKARTRADCALALAGAQAWAGGAALVFGGDLNLDHPAWPGLAHAAGHHVDHLLCAGWVPAGPPVLPDAGALSDHRPLLVELRPAAEMTARAPVGEGPCPRARRAGQDPRLVQRRVARPSPRARG